MNTVIDDNNLYLFIPGKASMVAMIYADKHGGSPLDALRKFYHSKTYSELEHEQTKYWHYGPVALYEDWTQHMQPECLL